MHRDNNVAMNICSSTQPIGRRIGGNDLDQRNVNYKELLPSEKNWLTIMSVAALLTHLAKVANMLWI